MSEDRPEIFGRRPQSVVTLFDNPDVTRSMKVRRLRLLWTLALQSVKLSWRWAIRQGKARDIRLLPRLSSQLFRCDVPQQFLHAIGILIHGKMGRQDVWLE